MLQNQKHFIIVIKLHLIPDFPMRVIYLILISALLIACEGRKSNTGRLLQKRIDSLEVKLTDSYKPGFADFMIGIQIHHSKLWFAGQNKNWGLADFEVKKIFETIDGLAKYQKERKEMMMMGMLTKALDSIHVAIRLKDIPKFISTYSYLTKTCNMCHTESKVEFNVIKIPARSPFTNQEFNLKIGYDGNK